MKLHKAEPIAVPRAGECLNLGCGKDIRPGFLNLDKYPGPGVDIVFDVERGPLLFRDDTFDYVLARDFLNHLPHRVNGGDGEFWNVFIDDLLRVSAPGAVWEFIHPARPESLGAGGHCRLINVSSFLHWMIGDEMGSLEADHAQGRLRLLEKRNIREWSRNTMFGQAVLYNITLEVVK